MNEQQPDTPGYLKWISAFVSAHQLQECRVPKQPGLHLVSLRGEPFWFLPIETVENWNYGGFAETAIAVPVPPSIEEKLKARNGHVPLLCLPAYTLGAMVLPKLDVPGLRVVLDWNQPNRNRKE